MTSERLVRCSNSIAQGQAAGKEAQRGWCILALLYEYVVVDVSSVLDRWNTWEFNVQIQ